MTRIFSTAHEKHDSLLLVSPRPLIPLSFISCFTRRIGVRQTVVPLNRHPGMVLAGIQCLSRDPKTLDACLRRHDVHDTFPFSTRDGTRVLPGKLKSIQRQAAKRRATHKTNLQNASSEWDSNGSDACFIARFNKNPWNVSSVSPAMHSDPPAWTQSDAAHHLPVEDCPARRAGAP